MIFYVQGQANEGKNRLDKLLVLSGHADNVNKAKALIMSGKVIVNDKKVDKQALNL